MDMATGVAKPALSVEREAVADRSRRTGGTVGRRQNYGFEKRQRELKKKKKKELKAERKRLAKALESGELVLDAEGNAVAPEEFSEEDGTEDAAAEAPEEASEPG